MAVGPQKATKGTKGRDGALFGTSFPSFPSVTIRGGEHSAAMGLSGMLPHGTRWTPHGMSNQPVEATETRPLPRCIPTDATPGAPGPRASAPRSTDCGADTLAGGRQKATKRTKRSGGARSGPLFPLFPSVTIGDREHSAALGAGGVMASGIHRTLKGMSNQPVEATETRGSVWSTQTSGGAGVKGLRASPDRSAEAAVGLRQLEIELWQQAGMLRP
jgi:hypothetical protein